MQKLPIGIQTFQKIRQEDYIYIDKTKEALELTENYSYVFLSRPRRFGKSLFLDTLKNIFEGKKEFFKGLYIYDKWDWDTTYPVIKISWDGKLRSIEDLKEKLNETLLDNQKRLQIECDDSISDTICFERLIKQAYEKYNQKVVILIDEYDKPILDMIDNIEQAKEHREYIKGLYSIIKGCDEYVRFAFLTGVSKFSKASIFSGLNMLTDISLNPVYGNICGYTHENIKNEFKEHMQGVDLEKLKKWYNGYNFLKDDVYNPFDILQFIANNKTYKNYWFATGTPSFLIKLIEQNSYFLPKLSNLIVDEKLLDSFDIENIDLEVILYQSGYLTIEDVKEKRRGGFEYKLRLPNKEVKISLNDYIIEYIAKDDQKEKHQDDLYDALADGRLDLLEQTLKSLFASIPYNNYTNNQIATYEGFYASVLYAYLQSLGIEIIGEDVTNKGRIDLTLFIEDKIYIIEFKVVNNKNETNGALKQIKEKKYYEKYKNHNKQIFLVGIELDSQEKNVVNFEGEQL